MGNIERTADTVEMETNKQAYGEGNTIIYLTDAGRVYYDITKIPSEEKIVKKIIKDDVNLQNHNTGSGLDITSFSMYSGFEEPNKKPERVIVGVAGTDLSNSVDRHKMSIYV